MRRLQPFLLSLIFFVSSRASFASDWVDDEVTRPRTTVPVPSGAVSTLPPFASAATPGTIASSGIQLHFRQALDALELEIFASRNTKSAITQRLDALEKAVFGSKPLEELTDNMQRLHRLLSVVHLSEYNLVAAAGKTGQLGQSDGGSGTSTSIQQSAGTNSRIGFWRTVLGVPRDTAAGANRVLHSPTFWTLVGVAGVLVCGYLLARRAGNYYEDPCVNRANPNAHFVNRPTYNAAGQMVRPGYWASNPNGTMTDNFSTICNVNPYTGRLGYSPAWY